MKNTNGKIALILAFLMILASVLSFPASAAYKNGDKLGDVLNSDIKTYINGERIPCYNIKNKAVVIVADLRNYGFDVFYDNVTRTSTITRNYNKILTPIPNVENTTSGKIGSIAFSYVFTDITAILGGDKIESFNVQGNLAIFFESLGNYSDFTWDNATRASRLTLTTSPKTITIKGTKYSTDLTYFNLVAMELTDKDIEPLKYVPNLICLELANNKISDVSVLKGFNNLTTLGLGGNQINDISALKGLNNLTFLGLWDNQISDINVLKGLTNLAVLDMPLNQINDISVLVNLPDLRDLFLRYNQINDISALKDLTKLEILYLGGNQIDDISVLGDLINLEILDLENNQISNISVLGELTNLLALDLAYNQINDISPLKNLTNLDTLHLQDNQISDISALSGLTNLKWLVLNNNQISDVSALKSLTNLEWLFLRDNPISEKQIAELQTALPNCEINY